MLNNLTLTLLFAISTLGSGTIFAQGSSTKTLPTNDNWLISLTYYPSAAGKESPVVVFLHGEKTHRKFWDVPGISWPEDLQKQGVACITVDLRKHGESKPPGMDEVDIDSRDNQAMIAFDMAEVKKFIYDEHQDEKLNMRKMAIVGVEEGCVVALNYAMVDWQKKPWSDAPTLEARTPRGQDVRALILISPNDRVSGVTTNRAINFLRNPALGLSVLIMYGNKDTEDDGDANKIYKKFKSKDDEENPRIFEVPYGTKARGFDLINNNEQAKRLAINFIDKHLKAVYGEWVNRRSPLDTSIEE